METERDQIASRIADLLDKEAYSEDVVAWIDESGGPDTDTTTWPEAHRYAAQEMRELAKKIRKGSYDDDE